jgi:hypothetical protein
MEFASQLQQATGKGYLSYSSVKHALNDIRLWEMYMAGQLRKESQALSFGSVYDTLLFEPEKYESLYHTFDDKEICAEIGGKNPRATKKYKEWKEDLYVDAKALGKDVVSEDDYIMAIDMISRLDDCGLLESHLTGEVQLEFNSWIEDIPVRGFLDCKIPGTIIDSKSTRSIGGFKRDIFNFGYDIQAYIYTSVFPDNEFAWVAQEKAYPYLPALVHASEETLRSGEYKFWKAVDAIKHHFQLDRPASTFYKEFYV